MANSAVENLAKFIESSKARESFLGLFSENKKFLEQFVVELLKYNRECDASVEVRFYKDTVGIIIHSLSPTISEIELEATRDIDKIKKDVMYYYADKQ